MNKGHHGKKLIIHYQADTGEVVSDADYWLMPFIKMPDSIKIALVSKLLEFGKDTTRCCLPVIMRSFNGIEGCGGMPDGTVRYDLQIDALFMINRLCWPHWIELFSCVPVLYDQKEQRVINDAPGKIAFMFDRYRQWFASVRAAGVIPKEFPFNSGRYVWYHGRKWRKED